MSEQSLKQKMAEVEKFKSAIPRVRDILRSCSITGMDSMRHICFYLLSRYITNENVDELEIPKHLSWENIFVKSFEDEDIALQLFKVDLIDQFDNLFGTQQFSFDVKNGVKHKEILEIFNNISMKDIDLHMDILGYVYEQHLKTGSTAARDLGQFFTDRFICEYMVKICEPKLKKGGIPESVCDPTMGTGGFLTAYLKYFKDVDWSKYQNQVHGVDHDAKVAGVSRLNMFMESGGQLFKHLHTADSLHGGLTPTTYDIILANMPFGLKGLKYADVHQSIKALGLNGTKSEPLFLQLMMVSLNKGGRCAVVVPDGMLVNNSKCHNGTRKYLIDNFELKRVIKMKGKFFMNTGIQPSILFFENSGKKTDQVEFWDVERDDKGNFSEKVVVSVPVEKFDESYSLDMRKYQETEKKNYNNDFRVVKLGDIIKPIKGKRFSVSDGKDEGLYPLIRSSKDGKVKWMDTYEYQGPYLTVGNGGFANFQVNEKFNASTHTLVYDTINGINVRYVLHTLNSMKDFVNEKCFSGTGLKNLNIADFHNLDIPTPSLELQQQIVEELDAIYESKENSSNMIESLKKQIKSIINTSFKFERERLANVCTIAKGKRCLEGKETGYPYYDVSCISRNVEKYIVDEECVLTPRAMSIGRFVYVNEKCHPSDDMFILKPNSTILVKYLYYFCKNSLADEIKRCIHGIKPTITYDAFDTLYIYIPPLEIQKSIVERVDKLEEQITCLEQIETQADENAKFILDEYLGV